jgi:hypothetical protein
MDEQFSYFASISVAEKVHNLVKSAMNYIKTVCHQISRQIATVLFSLQAFSAKYSIFVQGQNVV